VSVQTEPALTEETFARDPGATLARLRELASTGSTTMICSQGGVIPQAVADWSGAEELASKIDVAKASAWVLSVGASPDGPKPYAAQFLASPLDDETWSLDIPHFFWN
jgi:8-oxo-dGTP diphosphatase